MKKSILAISLVALILGVSEGETFASIKAEKIDTAPEDRNTGLMKRIRDGKKDKPQTEPLYFKKAKWMTSVDFLWWQSNAGALKLMTHAGGSLDAGGGSTIGFSLDASIVNLKYRWDPGFRVGVARFFDGLDGWDCFFNGTYFYGTGVGHANIAAALTISPDTIDFSLPSKTNWHLNYYTFDLELGRNFFFYKKVQLRPHFGFRGAIINQNVNTTLGPLTTILNTTGSPIEVSATSKSSNHFSGFGIRGGGRLIWELTKNIGLLGQLSGTAILGEFDLATNMEANANLSIASVAGISAQAVVKADDAYFKLRSNLEGLAGLYFKIPMHKKKHLLEMIVGYETAIWFKQNELNNFTNSISSTATSVAAIAGATLPSTGSTNVAPSSHLALRGLTFNMRYSF